MNNLDGTYTKPWPWYIYSCLATMIVCLIFLGFWGAGKYIDSRPTSNEQLEECINIAVDFARNGDIELREYLRGRLPKKMYLSTQEYDYFMQRRQELIRQYYIKHFFMGQFQYHDSNSIGVTLPVGYIQPNKNIDKDVNKILNKENN